MNIRPGMLFNSRILREGENEGGTGGGANQDQPGAKPGENNDDNNVEGFTDIWDNPKDEGDQNANANNANATPAKEPVPAGEAFDTHIAGLDLTSGMDLNAVAAGIAEGNMEPLQQAMAASAASVYKNAVMDMNRVVESKIDAAVATAVKQSNGVYQADQATQQMVTALPFTNNDAIKPVAQAVMSKLVSQGKSNEDAIAGVRNFFAETSKLSANDLGMRVAPKNAPGSGNFGGGEFSDDDGAGKTDWIEALTG